MRGAVGSLAVAALAAAALCGCLEPSPQEQERVTRSSAGADLAALFKATPMGACLRRHGFTNPEAYDLRGEPDARMDGVAAVSDGEGHVLTVSWDAEDGFRLGGREMSAEADAAVKACRRASGKAP